VLVKKRTLFWVLTALVPVVLALSIWMISACLTYLRAPPGYGGASIGPDGKLIIGPKPPDLKTPLILSAVTVPLGIGWVALLVLWKRAPEDVVTRRGNGTGKARR
jgi:hypothetical protein